MNVDSIFVEARQLAFDGEREEARRLAYAILEVVPDYHDVRILIARTYSWDEMHTEARRELTTVLEQEPDNRDALLASIDNEFWAENHDAAVEIANVATRFYPIDVDVLLRSANAHHAAEMDREAARLLNRVDQINPTNREAADLRDLLQTSSQNYTLTGSYTYDHYSDFFDPSGEGLVELSRRSSFGKFMAV